MHNFILFFSNKNIGVDTQTKIKNDLEEQLESLKINQSGTAEAEAKSPPSGSSYPVVANQNLSLLNEALFKIFV